MRAPGKTLLAALIAAMALAAPAVASPTIEEFEVGSSETQAGGHPDLAINLKLGSPAEPEVAKNITVNLAPGVFGNPGAILKCRAADFAVNECGAGAQAGIVTLIARHEGDPNYILGTVPVYNMFTVSEEETGRFAFVAPIINLPVTVPVSVRSATDYGLEFKVTGIPQEMPLRFANFRIWGLPAEHSHDSSRFYPPGPGSPPGCIGSLSTACLEAPYAQAGLTVKPFVDNPSACTGAPLPVSLEVTSYQDPDNPAKRDAAYPATTGCEKQRFDPVLNYGLTTIEADSASGLDIQLRADQFLSGSAPSPSTLRTAVMTLPEGMTINPDAADGQTACTDEQARFGTNAAGRCPDNSKIGTIEVETPALDGPLEGSLYIGEPRPGDQYRVFMIFDGFGVHAKLFASFRPDPRTGQITMEVKDLPQTPFEEFDLHLFASDRGLIATPTRCTIYGAEATLTPWNGLAAPQRARPVVGVSSGPNETPCPGTIRPFKPRLVAGTSHPISGDFSNFTLRLDRDDGDQFLGDLNFRMPPGFTGDLSGIAYCSNAAIEAAARKLGRVEQLNSSCPAASQIGTTNVASGPGGHPFYAYGKMFLSGPFKGAPLSLAAVTPALAGPYDYGVVVVRVALHVDPLTAQVSAVSDTVPSIIGGVPIRMRSIQVNIDRPEFTINPTRCAPFTVDSQGIGDEGTVTDFSSYFQAVNCVRLPFRPSMKVKQRGSRKATVRSTNPELQFDLRTRPGDANIRSLTVTLPSAFNIDQRHLGNICSERELATSQCAGRTPIGKATTLTPLLDQPLSGPVYAVSGSGGLPRLAFILNGQVRLLPRAETTTTGGGRLQTTVPVVPDAAIGHFSLIVFGGKTGYLINTRDICANPPFIRLDYAAQNGKRFTQKVRVRTACKGAKKRPARRGGNAR